MNKSAFTKVAAAAAASAALLAAAPAHAFVYGVSHLAVQNLTISYSTPPTAVNSYTFNLTNNAELFGASAPVAQATCNRAGLPACSPVSPVLNAPAVNAPGSSVIRADNNFAIIGTGPAGSYSNADSVINSAQLVTNTPTSTEQIAESLLNANGTASAGSRVQSNTSLTFSLTLGATTNIALDFDADADLRAQIADVLGSYLAQADMQATFTLTRNSAGGGSVTWSPTGTVANDCVVAGGLFGVATCIETNDEENLNFQALTGTNPNDIQNSSFNAALDLSDFGININGLPAGDYTIGLVANTSTSLVRAAQVPEPGSVALAGLALAALGMTTRRRGRRQAR